jgi:hypothetical protein
MPHAIRNKRQRAASSGGDEESRDLSVLAQKELRTGFPRGKLAGSENRKGEK